MQIGTNHLGPFLLTELLMEPLQAAAHSRVVIMSSCMHDKTPNGSVGHIDFDDMNFKNRKYDPQGAYAQSKLANLLHAKEFARRHAGSGVEAVSVHPGWVQSNLIKHMYSDRTQFLMSPLMKHLGLINPDQGVQTSLHCILVDEVENGAHYSQNASPKGHRGGWPCVSPNQEANDPDVATRLWDHSSRLVGLVE